MSLLGLESIYRNVSICCYLIHTHKCSSAIRELSCVYAQGTKDTRSHLCSFASNIRNTFSKEKHPGLLLDVKNLCWACISNTLLLKVQRCGLMQTHVCGCGSVSFNFFFFSYFLLHSFWSFWKQAGPLSEHSLSGSVRETENTSVKHSLSEGRILN